MHCAVLAQTIFVGSLEVMGKCAPAERRNVRDRVILDVLRCPGTTKIFLESCKAWESVHLLSGKGLVGEEGPLCSLRPRHSQHLSQLLLHKHEGLNWTPKNRVLALFEAKAGRKL